MQGQVNELLPLPKLKQVKMSSIIKTNFYEFPYEYKSPIIYPSYTTSLGNTGNLTSFVNMNFIYPTYCQQMGFEESMWFKIYLDDNYTVDSLEILRLTGCEKEKDNIHQQLLNILQLAKDIKIPHNKKEFVIRIQTECVFWVTD